MISTKHHHHQTYTDCCHNGSGMDLPYEYNTDGSLKRYNALSALKDNAGSIGTNLLRGNTIGALMGLVSSVSSVLTSGNPSDAQERTRQTRSSMADVIMFSGSKDSQTSKDTFIQGVGSTGAMSYALIRALNEHPNHSYLSLLAHLRNILEREYQQKPQLSSGYPMDMNRPFLM